MRTIVGFLTNLAIIFLSISCQKDITQDIENNLNDTIYLKYIDVDPDSSIVNLTLDCQIIISYEVIDTFYYGPHEYQSTRYTIKSKNTNKLKISYGKIDVTNQIIFLKQDSTINESLDWTNEYVSGGMSEGGSIGYSTKYVGVRLLDEDKIKYGWLHTPSAGKIAGFALDTTGFVKAVFAGQMKGIR
jgi:hypothetical protein